MRRAALLFSMLLLTLLVSNVTHAAPAGLKLAFVRGGDLWISTAGQERRLTDEGGISDPSFSYDGRFVTYQRGREHRVIDTTGNGPWPIPGGWSTRWSPRDDTLAVTDGKAVFTVTVTEHGPGTPKAVASGWTGDAWSPDGRQLAVSRREPSERTVFEGIEHVGLVPRSGGAVKILLTEGYPLQTGNAPVGGAMPIAWSQDGQWLLLLRGGLTPSMAADSNQFAVVSVRGGKAQSLGLSPNVNWAKWAPEGARLAYVDGAGRFAWSTKRLKLAAPPWEGPAWTVTPDGYADRDPVWSPDGRFIAFTRSLAQSPTNMDLPAPGQVIHQLDVDAKGSRPVVASEGGFCPFWDGHGNLYWLTADGRIPSDAGKATVHDKQGVVLNGVDRPFSYYGQWACRRVLDSWSPAAREHGAGFRPSQQATHGR